MDLVELGDSLAALNASLNAASAVALLTGFVLIRRRSVHGHRAAMLTALTASGLFLAVVTLPLVLRLVYLVRRRRFHDHARLAPWVFPVWAYVSVTGLIVYLLLYRVYGYS